MASFDEWDDFEMDRQVSSRIEQFLFKQKGAHAVVGFMQSEKRLVLSVAPWEEMASVVIAEFSEATVTSVGVHGAEPDDLSVPWDIVGFDSYLISDEKWRFVLCCTGIEYIFESKWPCLCMNPANDNPASTMQ
jgi:hypothetical protein